MAAPPIPDNLEGGLEANKASEHIATTTTLLVLAALFTALRFVARRLQGAKYAADDFACLVALAFTYVTGANNYAMIKYGLGQHAANLDQATQETFFKLLLCFECVYVTGVASVKIALLLMYVRIFPTKGFRICSFVLGGLTVAWWLSICLVCIFQCNPIYRAWQPWLQIGKCIDLKASFIGNAIPNIATDAAIICLPMFQVWRLQVNLVQKLSLMAVFLLGTFVFFASIYRFTTIMQFDVMDTTWTLAKACTWCVVEVAVGLISVCLPTLRPLLVRVSHQFASAKDPSSKYSGSHNTELVTIGGGGGSKPRPRQFTEILANNDERFETHTYVGRSYSQAGTEKDLESNGSVDDEIPLRRGKKQQDPVIHINQDFKLTNSLNPNVTDER